MTIKRINIFDKEVDKECDKGLLVFEGNQKEDNLYISKPTLFKRFCQLNIALAKQNLFELSKIEFAESFFESIFISEYEDLPKNVFLWGRQYGFIGDGSDKETYIFPLAHLLLSLQKDKINQYIKSLLSKIEFLG